MNPFVVNTMSASMEAARIASEGQLGIITGSGPEAGLDLWTKLLHARRAQLGTDYRGDLDAPTVRIISLPTLGLSMDMDQHGEFIWSVLVKTARELAMECKSYTIACNTLHCFAERLHDLPGGRFVSVQETVRKELRSRGKQSFALLGASAVMALDRWSPYVELNGEFEIETIDGTTLDKLIYAIKTVGRSNSELSGEFMRIVQRLQNEVVVLGCTELPLITPLPTKHALLDVTSLLAEGLLDALTEVS